MPVEDIRRGDGPAVIRRLEAICTISKDGYAGRAGTPLRLEDWEKQLLLRLFARRPDGLRRHRTAMIGIPRKNGKSALGSGIALDGLFFDGQGAEVYSAAAEKAQAGIVFEEAKRSVKAQPELLDICEPMRDVLVVPSTNSVYRVLSAEAYSKEGLNISRAVVDELHAHQDDELWLVLNEATGARLEPLIVAITTAGVMSDRHGNDSVCYRTYKYGVDIAEGRVEDDSFFFAWWGAPEDADYSDPAVWERANPSYGTVLNPEDLVVKFRQMPEADFRTKRLNQWRPDSSTWLPAGAWQRCAKPKATIPKGARVVLGFDGSSSGDATALVACSVGPKPQLEVGGLWEKDEHDPPDWRAPRLDIMETVRQACRYWKVLEIAADPYIWVSDLEALAEEGLPVVKFGQDSAHMIPATQRFYELVVGASDAAEPGLIHPDDRDLNRHIGNATTKRDARGTRIAKESKQSKRRIDLAVAAVMAVDRAADFAAKKPPRFIDLNEVLREMQENGEA